MKKKKLKKLKTKMPTNKIIVPPLKSQGIKTKLVPWITDIAPKVKGKWIEPFFGTGVVAFNMKYEEVLAGDSNPHVINLYKNIQNGLVNPESIKKYLQIEGENLRNADDNGNVHYKAIRDRFNSEFSSFDFIFLSRAGFNGMMRFNKKGGWNIPFCKKPNRFAAAYITKITNQVKNVSTIINNSKKWEFENTSFQNIIQRATAKDIIYCDPPYFGRYVDYFNGWTEENEQELYDLLKATPAKFILSTWHHNNWRKNEMIDKYWNQFNILTKDHFYHSGAKVENRQTIVEALVCNFNTDAFDSHNHKTKVAQRELVCE